MAPTGWSVFASDVAREIQGGAIESFSANMPVAAGDVLAVAAGGVPAARDPLATGSLAVFTAAEQTTLPGGLLLQADIEEAQPSLSLATAAAPQWAVVGEPVTHVYRVANAGPSAASDIAVTVTAPGLQGVSSSRGTCEAGVCRITRLAAGESADISVVLGGGAAGDTLTSSATTGASSASAATTLTPPSVAPPPAPLTEKACVNVKIGTNDDELIEGSSFGDRLVGRGGRDLLHGYGAEDCLEGGSGSDVLGGGFGPDRLVGGYGNDRLYGDSGNDTLKGGNGRDSLSGGSGNDELLPGSGGDQVYGGPGNDRVSARDRTRDLIDCGPGRDTARVDRVDRVRGCESVSRR